MWDPCSPGGYPYEEEEVWAPQITGQCECVSIPPEMLADSE